MILALAALALHVPAPGYPETTWTARDTETSRSWVVLTIKRRTVFQGFASSLHPAPQWTSLTNRFPIPFEMQQFITFDRSGEIVGQFKYGDAFDPRNLVLSGDWIFGRFSSAWTMGGALYSSDPSQEIAVFDGKSSKPVAVASPLKVGHPVAVWRPGQALFMLPTQAMLKNKRSAEKITFQVRDSKLRLIETYVSVEKQPLDIWMYLADDSANWRPFGGSIREFGSGRQDYDWGGEHKYTLEGQTLKILVGLENSFQPKTHRLLATRVASK